MGNAFYNRGASFNPDELADGDAIEAEFDSVSRGFDTIENLVNVNKAGYPTQTFHVAPATEATHAVQKDQLDSGLAPKLDAASYTSADVLDKLKTVDGSTSGLDADLLDGQEGSYYRNASNINNGTLAKERLPASIDASTSGNAATASKVSNTAPDGGTADLVSGVMAGSDFFRIRVGGGPDAGWTEIATADNGNEPIYVRQYNLGFGSVTKELKLLDEYGNTVLPGLLQATSMQLKNLDGGFGEGNGDAASSSANNVKISSWFGIGFSPSISGQPVPYGEYSHWFNTRNGDMGVRGTITAARFAGDADRAASASANTFFTTPNGSYEGQIGATCGGYQPVYLFNNSAQWGVFSVDGGAAFTYTRGAGFNFNGHANSAAQAVAEASGYWDGVDLAYARMAGDDYFRLRAYGSGYDQGAVEIATSDGGNEPIYVRQYAGIFASVVRTAALLDGNGNTVFPGDVYAANGRLKEVAVLSGEIGHSGVMPLPAGFSEGQCVFFVSPRDTDNSGYAWDLREGINAEHYRIVCYNSGRTAYGFTRIYNDVNDRYEDRGFSMNYLVIGVK